MKNNTFCDDILCFVQLRDLQFLVCTGFSLVHIICPSINGSDPKYIKKEKIREKINSLLKIIITVKYFKMKMKENCLKKNIFGCAINA